MVELVRRIGTAMFGRRAPALTSLSKALMERFVEKLLVKKCTVVVITPERIPKWDCCEYTLLFQGMTQRESKPLAELHELCFPGSSEHKYARRDRLELFLMAERRGEELKQLLPDLTIEIYGLDGKMLSTTERAKILAQADGLNISI